MCTLIVLATAFVIPVSASSETSSDDNLILNGSNWALRQIVGGETQKHYLTNYSNPDFLSSFGENPLTSVKEERIEEILQKYVYDISSCYYIARVAFGDNGISVNFAAYDIEELGDTLNFYHSNIGGVNTLCSTPRTSIYAAQFRIKSSYLMGTDTDPLFVFNTGMDYTSQWIDNNYGTCYYNGIITNIPNITYDDKKINNDGSTPPVPFNISYSPDLRLNITRVNDGYSIETIKVIFDINPDYVDYAIKTAYCEKYPTWDMDKLSKIDVTYMIKNMGLDEIDIRKYFGVQGSIFISTLSADNTDYSTVLKNCVYTYLSKQNYSIIDKVVDGIDGATSTATSAIGLYPIWTTSINDFFSGFAGTDNVEMALQQYEKLKTYRFSFTVPINNINHEKYKSGAYTLYTVYGIQALDSSTPLDIFPVIRDTSAGDLTNDPDAVIPAFSGTISEFYSNKKHTFYEYSDFSFDTYPEYEPPTDEDGNEYSPNGSPTDFVSSPLPPSNYGTVNSDGTTTYRDKQEQIQHDKDVHTSQNMLTMDVTSIGTLLDGTSQYYRFLTAGLMIFPSWFLTAITAFFSILLTIVLVGTVVKLITGVVGSIGNFLGGGSS